MSWAEEQPWFGLEDMAIEIGERIEEAEKAIEQGFWLQNNGAWIGLCEMTTSHLQNCIRMIEQGRLDRPWALPFLLTELNKRRST